MKRYEDWPARLIAFLAARRNMAFAWGLNDCCMFAADAVAAITGVSGAAPFGGYKTARGAANRLRRHGGVAGVMERAAARHGWPEIAPGFAQRGDVVLLRRVIAARAADAGGFAVYRVHDSGKVSVDALGIVEPGGGVALPDENGLAVLPRSLAVRAWRIG